MVLIKGIWHEGPDPDTGEPHYCAKVSAFDPDIQFQRQLIAEIHVLVDDDKHWRINDPVINELLPIGGRFQNRWDFFNLYSLHLWVTKNHGR